MTVKYATPMINAKLDAITTFMGSGALLRLYNGTRPAKGGTATTLLAELTMGTPPAGAASSGIWTANTIGDDAGANATGTATWFRIVKSDGTTFVMDGDVGTIAPADLILASVNLVVSVPVAVSSFVITGGNI